MNRSFKESLIILLTGMVLAGCIPPAPTVPAVEGAPGMGDPYFPNLGNGGYDVQHYTIVLEVDPLANEVAGWTTISAKSTEALTSFNVDFHGLTVDSIRLNDKNAEYSRDGDELTISPAEPLEADKPFTAVIAYHGSPETVSSGGLPGMGWSHGESGVINVWGEPNAASTWFPNNNHPRDKATFRFEITVPTPWMVAATGSLKETKENRGRTTYIWEMDQPMATYLASINIDQYEPVTQEGPNGIKIRNYFPTDLYPSYRLPFAAIPEIINFLDDFFGPYPFPEYGVVVAGEDGLCKKTQRALEAQTLSIHCPSPFMTSEEVIVHELAHMWFGDSVSLENWKDIWLKEGFAVFASWLWEAGNDPTALARIAEMAHRQFIESSAPVAEPGANHLYSGETYTGGALVIYALKTELGDETFFQLLRTYTERYRGGNAGTDGFIALSEEVSGEELDAFFDAWLFSPTLPDLPN